MTASQLSGNDRLLALYYGPYGKGKTIALAHMAKLGKILYIDAERRLKSSVLKRLGIPVENIDRRVGVSYTMLEDLIDELDAEMAKGTSKRVGIAWDSATETLASLLGVLVETSVARDRAKGKQRDAWQTQQGDYGDVTQQMRKIVRGFRDLESLHLGMAALERRDRDEDGEVVVGPELTPGVMKDVGGYMDLIIRMEVDEVGGEDVYKGMMRPTGKYVGKDSFGIFPRYLVQPTFDRLVAYVNGDLSRDKDPVQAKMREIVAAQQAERQAKAEAAKAKPEPAVETAA